MDPSDHGAPISLNRLAVQATTHCLIGCGIGEVLGLVIGTALGWTTVPTPPRARRRPRPPLT